MAISLKKPPTLKSPSLGGANFSAPLLYALLQGYKNVGPVSISGPAFDQLAWAIAEGVDNWFDGIGNVALVGLATGTAGVGVIPESTTKLYMAPVIPLMTGGLSTAGVVGPMAPSLSMVVTLAMAHAITQFGGYTGIAPTVAVGTDISKTVFSNPTTLIASLQTAMAANKMIGGAAPQLATGLGLGIAALVLTVFGNGKVIGVTSPLPSSGPSFSKVA